MTQFEFNQINQLEIPKTFIMVIYFIIEKTLKNILSSIYQNKNQNCRFMGGCTSMESSRKHHNDQVIVATLNYGGILNSPFEFYSNQQQQEKIISQHFKALIPEYYKNYDENKFAWDIGKIDQKIQKERYTPIYRATVGVENGKLISTQRFSQNWNKSFQKAISKTKLQKQPTDKEIEFMRNFDLICYHALLRHVYKIKSITEVENKDATLYTKLMERFFSRSYLDEEKKLKLLSKILNDDHPMVNVFFFQEPTPALVRCLNEQEKFVVFEGGEDNSIIAVRNNPKIWKSVRSFEEVKKTNKISAQNAKKIESNPETRIAFCDKIIFICIHLSSKPDKNKMELEELKEGINILRQAFPDHEFVIGGDTNAFIEDHQIQDQKVQKRIHIFPNNPKEITTCKTRTYMQPQFNKAQKMAAECKDQLMSTLNMEHCDIFTIDKKKPEKQLNLPTESHPFDHMLVVGFFTKPKPQPK